MERDDLANKKPIVGDQPGGRGTSHMKGAGMLVGNFELNP